MIGEPSFTELPAEYDSTGVKKSKQMEDMVTILTTNTTFNERHPVFILHHLNAVFLVQQLKSW